MTDLAGKVALVTGGSRGIGAAIVRRLARDGAAVALTYVAAADKAKVVAKQIDADGGRVLVIRADNADPGASVAAVEQTVRELGRLDILVNNAGIFIGGPVEEATVEQADRLWAVDVRAVFVASQAAARHMSGGGRIITIGSALAHRASKSRVAVMWAHQAVADACCMHTKNYAIALPAAAGLAAVLLLTACGGGTRTSSHPSAGTTTSPAAARAVSTVTVTDQDDSNWAGYVVGNSATISLSDLTRHATFSKQLQMSSPTVSSAEWIAEAPSRCLSSSTQDCHILSLAFFGGVTFTGASASAGGRTGSITSGLGRIKALTLEANPGFGRLYATAAQADASPGALSGDG